MKLKKLNSKEAERLTKKLGLCWGDEQRTFYATNEEETDIWEFDSKSKRDAACATEK
jgi:hypothetical protein